MWAIVRASTRVLRATGQRLAAVVADRQLVGVVTAGDVAQAVELGALGTLPDRGREFVIPSTS